MLNCEASDPVFDDDNELDPYESEPEDVDFEYVTQIAGRELGEQGIPRFVLQKLRPFEAVFVDNKDCPCAVRGGATTTLLFVDYKTRTKHKVDLKAKTQMARPFRRLWPSRVYRSRR